MVNRIDTHVESAVEYTTRCQFYHHFMSTFCPDILAPKKLRFQNVTREKLFKALSYKKCVCKMLMKLTTGVNFTITLWAAFCTKDFCTGFMCLQFGFVISCQKKIVTRAARKMLVKLTLGPPTTLRRRWSTSPRPDARRSWCFSVSSLAEVSALTWAWNIWASSNLRMKRHFDDKTNKQTKNIYSRKRNVNKRTIERMGFDPVISGSFLLLLLCFETKTKEEKNKTESRALLRVLLVISIKRHHAANVNMMTKENMNENYPPSPYEDALFCSRHSLWWFVEKFPFLLFVVCWKYWITAAFSNFIQPSFHILFENAFFSVHCSLEVLRYMGFHMILETIQLNFFSLFNHNFYIFAAKLGYCKRIFIFCSLQTLSLNSEKTKFGLIGS